MTESRYNRQILVDGVGDDGQRRIRAARVAVVGSGALGCAVATQLVRGGIGYLKLIDPDVPEISNLQRQVLIDEEDVRKLTPKALAAAQKLRASNSEVEVDALVDRLDDRNAAELLGGVDLVLDGTDNFAARYAINRACVDSGTPFVFGGVLAASGMSFAVLPGGPCLHCTLGPEPPVGSVPTTSERGVLCAIVQTIAAVEVVRAMKLIIGHEVPPDLYVIDLWDETQRVVHVDRDSDCPVCAKRV
ncbi:MAG: HesA/MoeB/ThiF family protein [Deltaproteobacteria bacterium]|nr:HesA/MoeB/ThiF family protein [Deltaproteobacteria bacterium]